MQVSILEPKGAIYEGRGKEVILPVEDGEVAVLDFHQPFFCQLREGLVRVNEGTIPPAGQSFSIKHGLAVMRGNELTIFVEK